MNNEDFAKLKDGDKVVFTNPVHHDYDDDLPSIGSILIRKSSWIDDGTCDMFEFQNKNGVKDKHFFYACEVEVLKDE